MAGYALAEQILPVSYEMLNGGVTGTGISLLDEKYSGGNAGTPYAQLTGGTGDLTGSCCGRWMWWKGSAPLGVLGWGAGAVSNPTITFHFRNLTAFTEVAVRTVKQYRPGSVSVTIGANPPETFANFNPWAGKDSSGNDLEHEWLTFDRTCGGIWLY